MWTLCSVYFFLRALQSDYESLSLQNIYIVLFSTLPDNYSILRKQLGYMLVL